MMSVRLIDAVVHCMFGESADDHVWKWLLIDHSGDVSLESIQQACWRSFVLRALLQNKMFWAESEAPNGINEALEVFGRVIQSGAGESVRGLLLSYSGLWLGKQLRLRRLRPVRVGLYDQFVHQSGVWIQDRDDLRFNRACMDLCHPKGPNAERALRFIKENERLEHRSIFCRDLFEPQDWRVAARAFWFLVDTAQILGAAGLQTESRYVLDFGRKTIPSCFAMKPGNEYQGQAAAVKVRFLGRS